MIIFGSAFHVLAVQVFIVHIYRRLLPQTRNWPDRVILVLDDDSCGQCLHQHRKDVATYDKVRQMKGPLAKAVALTL